MSDSSEGAWGWVMGVGRRGDSVGRSLGWVMAVGGGAIV